MYRQRMNFMQSLDKWLHHQEPWRGPPLAPGLAAVASAGPALEQGPSIPEVQEKTGNGACTFRDIHSSHLGPQKPCPQPRTPDQDMEAISDGMLAALEEVPEANKESAWRRSSALSAEPAAAASTPSDRASANSAVERKPRRISVSHSETSYRLAEQISRTANSYLPPAQKRMKSRAPLRGSHGTHGRGGTMLERLVWHPAFDSTCAAMILFNSAIIGFGVEYMTTHDEEPFFLVIAGHVCSAFFFVELVLRMKLLGRGFFRGENKWWNMFDFWLVTFSFIDIIITEALSLDASRVGSGMKTIKMLRIVRVFRVFRFFRELSLLALMIIDSMKSLAWALILLTIIIYVFAICFTSRATEHEKLNGAPGAAGPQQSEVHRQFGSLGRTVYSLVQAMLGGVSWGVCADALLSIDAFSGFLFFFYVAFTILAVMNIITGVFVDNAVETARTQRDFLIQKEMELKEKYCNEMRALFAEMDSDGSGSVSFLEVQQYLEDPRVQGYFTALGLDPNDTERLFKLIDTDNTGDVDIGEFLDGCIRLKGQARSIDVYSIMRDLKNLEMKLDSLREGPSPVTGSWFMGDCLVPGALPSSAPTGRT